jgi:hypothetical protein
LAIAGTGISIVSPSAVSRASRYSIGAWAASGSPPYFAVSPYLGEEGGDVRLRPVAFPALAEQDAARQGGIQAHDERVFPDRRRRHRK